MFPETKLEESKASRFLNIEMFICLTIYVQNQNAASPFSSSYICHNISGEKVLTHQENFSLVIMLLILTLVVINVYIFSEVPSSTLTLAVNTKKQNNKRKIIDQSPPFLK